MVAMIDCAKLLQVVRSFFIMETTYFHLKAIEQWVFETPVLRPLLLSDTEWNTLFAIADILRVRHSFSIFPA